MNQHQRGFNLIELMITVVIIGILASVAMPSYQRYMLSSNRGEGMSTALDILRAQENYAINNLTYTTDLRQLGYSAVTYVSPDGLYQFSAGTCGTTAIADCVNITATALSTQASDGNLTINSRGERTGNWDL